MVSFYLILIYFFLTCFSTQILAEDYVVSLSLTVSSAAQYRPPRYGNQYSGFAFNTDIRGLSSTADNNFYANSPAAGTGRPSLLAGSDLISGGIFDKSSYFLTGPGVSPESSIFSMVKMSLIRSKVR